jgi:hypothetical protein
MEPVTHPTFALLDERGSGILAIDLTLIILNICWRGY